MWRRLFVSLTALALTAPVAAAQSAGVLPPAPAPPPLLSPGDSATCAGPATPAGIARLPGPVMRFGISPLAQAGQVGPTASPVPDDPAKTLAALQALRAGHPFVLRLTRLFWSDGEAGIARYLALAHTYTAAGLQVELQLRYHPPSGHDGDIAGWVAWSSTASARTPASSGCR
jgi:hypothetical protein